MLSEHHPLASLPLPAGWFLGHALEESTKLEREGTSTCLGINTVTWGVQKAHLQHSSLTPVSLTGTSLGKWLHFSAPIKDTKM